MVLSSCPRNIIDIYVRLALDLLTLDWRPAFGGTIPPFTIFATDNDSRRLPLELPPFAKHKLLKCQPELEPQLSENFPYCCLRQLFARQKLRS
jgi:hypothetical protein